MESTDRKSDDDVSPSLTSNTRRRRFRITPVMMEGSRAKLFYRTYFASNEPKPTKVSHEVIIEELDHVKQFLLKKLRSLRIDPPTRELAEEITFYTAAKSALQQFFVHDGHGWLLANGGHAKAIEEIDWMIEHNGQVEHGAELFDEIELCKYLYSVIEFEMLVGKVKRKPGRPRVKGVIDSSKSRFAAVNMGRTPKQFRLDKDLAKRFADHAASLPMTETEFASAALWLALHHRGEEIPEEAFELLERSGLRSSFLL
ncbi:MAG: hypothetical protein AAGM38_11585 [Pseudomonadota bacterium]